MILFFKAKPFPAWILAEKIVSEEPPEEYVEIHEQDLSRFPQLAEAIQNADDAYRIDPVTGLGIHRTPPGPMLKMDHENGRALLSLLGGEYQNKIKSYNFRVKVNDTYYILEMIFASEPPKLA